MIIKIHTHDLKKSKAKTKLLSETGINDIQTHLALSKLNRTHPQTNKIHEFNENKNSRLKFVRLEKG